MARPVSLTFADDAQIYIPAHVPPNGRLAYNVLDLLDVHAATADEPLYLNVWAVTEAPADPLDAGLDAADRIGDGPFPLGSAPARTVAVGARCSRVEGAGFVVSITTGTDATGDPTAPAVATFALEND